MTKEEALAIRLTHAEALRKWHRREPPYDNPKIPAPVLPPEAGEWTSIEATQ